MKDKNNFSFSPITGLTNCSNCGKRLTYKGRGSYLCEYCGSIEYDDFGRIDQYIEENGPSTAPVMSRALGIPIGKIHELVAQGRLEPLPSEHRTLDDAIYANAIAAEAVYKRTGTFISNPAQHEDDRMRFLQRKGGVKEQMKPSDKKEKRS